MFSLHPPKIVAQQLVAWKCAQGLGVSKRMDSVSCTVVWLQGAEQLSDCDKEVHLQFY